MTPEEEWKSECLRWRGVVLTGQHSHYCEDYDYLPMDETCLEWPCACCKDGACLQAQKEE